MDLSAKLSLRLAVLAFVLVCFNNLWQVLDWPETQLLFTYDVGFHRRALVGEVISWFSPNGLMKAQVNAIGMLITLAGATAMVAIMLRELLRVRGGGAVVLVFVTSLGFCAFVGNTGYLGGIMFLLTAAALYLPMTAMGLLLRALLCVVGVLVHENMLPVYATLISAEAFLRARNMALPRRVFLSALPLLCALVATGVVTTYGTLPFSDFNDLHRATQARALDFDVRLDTLEPVAGPGPGGRGSEWVWMSPFHKFVLVTYGGIGFLLLAVQSWFIWRLTERLQVLERVVAILAGWAPMSLLCVAFDVSRFVAFASINSFLMIAILCRDHETCRARLYTIFSPVVILVFLLLSTQIELRTHNDNERHLVTFPGRLIYMVLGD
mgnify:CR=1 FL=1